MLNDHLVEPVVEMIRIQRSNPGLFWHSGGFPQNVLKNMLIKMKSGGKKGRRRELETLPQSWPNSDLPPAEGAKPGADESPCSRTILASSDIRELQPAGPPPVQRAAPPAAAAAALR